MEMKQGRVSRRVLRNLVKLDSIYLKLSLEKNESIKQQLSQTPRTGKALRIDKYRLNLPKRSLLDHVTTLARNADIFLNVLSDEYDWKKVADMVVFHDLSEVIIGDAPENTSKALAQNYFKTKKAKKMEESSANILISKHLSGNLKIDFDNTFTFLEEVGKPECALFQMIDKIDPILAIWRYIYYFKNNIKIDYFIHAMSDYFTAPNRTKFAINKDCLKLMRFLLNKENAKNYYLSGNSSFKQLNSKIFNPNVLSQFIEAVPMHFIASNQE